MSILRIIQWSGILLLGTCSTMIHAEDLESRISSLEKRVALLEDGSASACLERVDGVVPAGARTIVKSATGTWVYGPQFVATFEIQLLKKFSIENGKEVASVRIYGPGFSPKCGISIIAVSDLLLY